VVPQTNDTDAVTADAHTLYSGSFYSVTGVLTCAGDEVLELNGELLSGLSDEVLHEIVRGAELGGGEVELLIRLQ